MPTQKLLTLPPRMVECFHRLENRPYPEWFVTADPDQPLGSGAGTAHALLAAWKQSETPNFSEWLNASRRLVIHAGGQSRRLPSYAAVGKALMPIPVVRGSRGQRPDQALVDLQLAEYEGFFAQVSERFRVMIISGDALVRLPNWPTELPEGDVICIAMRADAETARTFGAFFTPIERPAELAFVRQKPSPEETRALMTYHDCLLDVGVWLLSEQAVNVLLAKSGGSTLHEYDLYGQFGLSLGSTPTKPDDQVSPLSAHVVPVNGQFLHFGTSRQLIESVTALHDQTHHSAPLGFLTSAHRRANQHVQNAELDSHRLISGQPYWIENADIASTWHLAGENVITGAPQNDWSLSLPVGICLDFVPIGEETICLRPYGVDDAFKGAISSAATLFLGRPLIDWLAERGLEPGHLGTATTDIQNAPLFPQINAENAEKWISWFISTNPSAEITKSWTAIQRLSASDLMAAANPDRIYADRRRRMVASLAQMQQNHRTSVFYSLDLEQTAEILHRNSPGFAPTPLSSDESLVKKMHDAMFRSALSRLDGEPQWETAESEAFDALQSAILSALPQPKAPLCGVAPDQIVWGRAPLRLDLAGGWTDTPPYCLLNGGRVLNVAVNLNGQPPVQVFLRRSDRPEIVLRSIDLGTEKRITTFAELAGGLTEKSEFSLAQAALGLAGFGPETGERDLSAVLNRFGGGIEMSLLAAVPKGSGLGTSSILASTILGALGEFCQLNWSSMDVMMKTLALEQILSTGGGWQDQAGGCLPGIKELETAPGLIQSPTCRWLPERILGPETANSVALLYYTGITRVAKSILREIVRGMFLNSGPRLDTIRRIGENVDPMADAIRRHDWQSFAEAVDRSWRLNQALDSGTNTPAVQSILNQVNDYLIGAKLLGAGGGGFLLLIAKDPEAGQRIRRTLQANPPSLQARFFDFTISQVGLEVTKS